MLRKFLFILLIFTWPLFTDGQNTDYAKQIIKTLSSPEFHGRGYVNEGEKKAANFIREELQKNKIKAFNDNYFQRFYMPVNTFPGKISISVNKKNLQPGKDYIIAPYSTADSGQFATQWLTADILNDSTKFSRFINNDLSQKILIVDTTGLLRKDLNDVIIAITKFNALQARAVVELMTKDMYFSAATRQSNFVLFQAWKENFPKRVDSLKFIVESEYHSNYPTQNVLGYIPGKVDSFLVFSAHYDHLGRMGKETYFPGAHDNASGVAILLDLARKYSQKKKPYYNIAFFFFGGEESGLLGSQYYTQSPVFPLEKIKFLFNLDQIGSGKDGIKIVNATQFDAEFSKLKQINQKGRYLKDIFARGPAPISDHYYFYEKGVKTFFIYTLGDYKNYHNIYDKAEKLPLTAYEELFMLLDNYIESYYPKKNTSQLNE